MPVYIDIGSEAGQHGGGPLTTDMAAIQNKMMNLFKCPIGSRFRQPEFGCRLNEYVHELVDPITTDKILNDLLSALSRWMKGEVVVTMAGTYVVPTPTGDGYYIKICFSVPKLRSSGSLAFSALRD